MNRLGRRPTTTAADGRLGRSPWRDGASSESPSAKM